MWYQNIGSMFCHFVTMYACDGRTDRQDRQNYDPQDRSSIAASHGKNCTTVVTSQKPWPGYMYSFDRTFNAFHSGWIVMLHLYNFCCCAFFWRYHGLLSLTMWLLWKFGNIYVCISWTPCRFIEVRPISESCMYMTSDSNDISLKL